MERKKVLITGGLGFIGINLTKECIKRDYETTIISKSDNKIKNIKNIEDKVNLIFKDIKYIDEEVKDKDYIFHMASTVDNYNILEDPYLDIKVNCNRTISLLEACKKHDSKAKIVYPSTFFVNGNLKKLPATPESPTNPLGLYPATKLAAENFCQIYNNIFGLNTSIARLTNVFWENEENSNKKKAAFNYLINLAIEDKEIPVYGDGKFKRDYIYIDDVVQGLLTIAEKGNNEQIYYVGNGKGIEFNELINLIIKNAGSGRIKYINPPEFHNKVGILDFFCDNTPLKNLGWKSKNSIEEGIKKTIIHYKKGN